MLTILRSKASSWVVKILFAVLVLSFAVWGIGDIFRGPGQDVVIASVGDIEIRAREFSTQLNRQVQGLSKAIGMELTDEQLRGMGLVDGTLDNLIERSLFDAAAADMGLSVSNELVRDRILSTKEFKDEDNRFSEFLFRRNLIENGYSEESYVTSLRRELSRIQLIDSIEIGVALPETMLRPLTIYRWEKRAVDRILIKAAEIPGFDSPEEALVRAYYEEHPDSFQSPAYRSVTMINLAAKDLADKISIADEVLAQTYEDRIDGYSTPPRRRLEQIHLENEEDIKRAAETLAKEENKGRKFLDMAKEITGREAQTLNLDWNLREDLPDEIVEDVFALGKGAVSAPMKSPFGWHIIHVTGVEEENIRSFEEVKEGIREELAAEEALDALYEIIKQVEDEFAGGASLETVADNLNLKVTRLEAIDATGKNAEGEAIAGLPGEKFTNNVFKTREGEQADLVETEEDGFYVLRVDKVTPPGLMPLAKAYDKVVDTWRQEQQKQSAKAQASLIADKVKAGEDITVVAGDLGLEVETSEPFTREGTNTIPPELTQEIFASGVGHVGMAETSDGFVVARVASIESGDTASNDEESQQMQDSLMGSMGSDLINQFAYQLRQHYKISVNKRALDDSL
ncbi:MAG: SurA N-terminal domain-containing protein [Alphaproteobacteria bacterium]|nr:SurA N-terminal domain-containing protein [Alphaproteobacteria bacterium]